MTTPTPDEQERLRANALSALRNTDWKLQAALFDYQARQMFVKFKACKDNGFSVTEALSLCWRKWEM
jgi:hypothetical protein